MTSNHQCKYNLENIKYINGFYIISCALCGVLKTFTRGELDNIKERRNDMPDFFKDLFK